MVSRFFEVTRYNAIVTRYQKFFIERSRRVTKYVALRVFAIFLRYRAVGITICNALGIAICNAFLCIALFFSRINL